MSRHNLSPEAHFIAVSIIRAVAEAYELNYSDLLSRTRQKRITEARQVAMFALRDQLHLPFKEIAALFNKKDHGSAMHAVRVVPEFLQVDRMFTQRWPRIVKRVLAARHAAENNTVVVKFEEVA